MSAELQVSKTKLASHRVVDRAEKVLGEGEVRLSVEYFALTANNITYGAAGDRLGYWQFFPVDNETGEDWGIIPVWGFADVAESNCADLPVGDRVYGYFPPAASVVMLPVNCKPHSFVDGAVHRQALPPLYNRYQRVSADASYSKEGDVPRMLLSPLHLTSYCIWDHLKQQNWFGAEQVIIVSASSKTSLGVAVALDRDDAAPTVVGLTSQANKQFVADTTLYAATIAYDEIAALLEKKSAVIVDMAGNPNVRHALQAQLGDQLQHYISVGLKHWDEEAKGSAGDASLVPIKSQEMFFAPTYILERMKTLAPGEFEKNSSEYLKAATEATFGWMEVKELGGIEALAELYPSFVEGTLPPSAGYVVKL